MVVDLNCEYLKPYFKVNPNRINLPSHYSGVFQLMPPQYVIGLPLWTGVFLGELVQNSSIDLQQNSYYHDAFDPALRFNYDSGMWDVTADLKDTMLWTESNWDSGNQLGVRVYGMEDPMVEKAMLITGLLVLFFTALGTYFGMKLCKTKYKPL